METLFALTPPLNARKSGTRAWWPLLLGVALLTGCDGKKTAPATSGTAGEKGSASKVEDEQAAAQKKSVAHEAMLENVRNSLDLNKLGISTDLNYVVSMLNQWRTAAALPVEPVAIPARIEKLIGREAGPQFSEPQFTLIDGLHLRDCMVAHAVAQYAAGETRNELVRTANLFEYVVRSIRISPNHLGWIQLPAGQKIDIPLTQYDTCVFGFGTAQDRVSLFSSLLRQFGIDSVILTPATSAEDVRSGADYFLVGVLLGKEVYLFDPYLGVPIPALPVKGAASDRPAVATLRQAVASDALFRQLDPLPKVVYPLRAEQFKRPHVRLIGTVPLWSARTKLLQTKFSGQHSMAIYDSLADAEGQPGLLTRVAAAGGEFWNGESLGLWTYPQQVLLSTLQGQVAQAQILSQLSIPLGAPYDWSIGASRRVELQQPQRLELKARLAHLNGGFQSALKLYVDVRKGAKNDPRMNAPPGTPIVLMQDKQAPIDATYLARIIFDRSDDDAVFFTGMCQYDRGDYRAASETLRKYLNYFNRSRQEAEQALKTRAIQQGQPEAPAEQRESLRQAIAFRFFWVNSVRFNLAMSHVRLGNRSEAARTLRDIPAANPQFAGYLHYMQLWDPAVAAEVRKELQKNLDETLKKTQDEAKKEPQPGAVTPTPPKKPEQPGTPPSGSETKTGAAKSDPAKSPEKSTVDPKATSTSPAKASPASPPAGKKEPPKEAAPKQPVTKEADSKETGKEKK